MNISRKTTPQMANAADAITARALQAVAALRDQHQAAVDALTTAQRLDRTLQQLQAAAGRA